MSVPILIVIPFWEGDKTQAIEICKIVAGLQSAHAGHTAHVMLSHRQDCKMDQNMIKIIAPKFNVLTYKCTSPLRGWPQGPNGMFGSTMIRIANSLEKTYECVYWLEPDAVPIRPNWFWDLVLEWRKKHPNSRVVGCRADCHGDGTGEHISGSCLYHPNIARLMPYLTTCQGVAWDYQHRTKIIQVGTSTKLIQNRYHQRGLPASVIEEPGVVVIHGVKDRSVTLAVAKKYGLKLD